MIKESSTGKFWGTIVGLTAFFFFVSTNIVNKFIFSTTNINTWHVAYWRGLFLCFINMGICNYQKIPVLEIKKECWGTLLLRSLVGGISVILNTFQYSLLTISKAQSIYYTYPIWTAINGWLLLGEKITRYDVMGIVSAFIGVLTLILNKQAPTSSSFQESPYGIPVGLAAAWSISIGDVLSRKLGNGVSFYITSAFLGIMLAVEGAFFMTVVSPSLEAIHDYSLWTAFLLITVSVLSWIALTLLTKAYQLEKAARIAVLAYVQILVATAADVLYFGNRLSFTDILGCSLIVSGNFLVLILKCFDVIA